MKTNKILSKIIDGMILLIFILLLLSAGFRNSRTSGWYQQWLPNLNGSTITDITFLDSLTGFAVTNSNSLLQAYILRTTNGGDNWNINYTSNSSISFIRIISIDSNIVFAVKSYTEMYKTTNYGNSWDTIPFYIFCHDIAIINKDTMLAVNSSGFDGGVYRSTNGGLNWTRIWTGGTSVLPYNIYMFNKDMGFFSDQANHFLMKTTNGGFNWFYVNDTRFVDMKFADTLIGYKTYNPSELKKTTDGGLTWFNQTRPSFFLNWTLELSVVNKDTVWYVGPQKYSGGYGVIMKTTNGGLNWGYQIPFNNIGNYYFINFTDKNHGWAYQLNYNGVHTTTGGSDTTIYVGLTNENEIVPEEYVLEQNYPNPFNSMTNVKFKMLNAGNVKIKVSNITGKEVVTLVNKKLQAGTYEVRFEAGNLPSGIYFYSMETNDIKITKKSVLIK